MGKIINWLLGRTPTAEHVATERATDEPQGHNDSIGGGGFFSTHTINTRFGTIGGALETIVQTIATAQPLVLREGTLDHADTDDVHSGDPASRNRNMIADRLGSEAVQGMSEALAMWYASNGFIGHQMCTILSQHWLINKACAMPGRDAIRKGYTIEADSGDLGPNALKIFKRFDKKFTINKGMAEYIRLGRIFGIRIAFAKIESTDPKFYERPFNPDGITPGSYKGIVQVDPYWCAPIIDQTSTSQPDTLHFYEPTWWLINGKKYHRTHLIIFKTCELPDILKPVYLYGGMPVPQLIMERVYAAERVANEAPALAMSKRTTAFGTDTAKALADETTFKENMLDWINYRDNYGVKIYDKTDDEMQQFDTALADFDALIMTQYQIVAAAAAVPATKLLGTTPKGFNSTGEYEESNYHEELESIQTHDLTPLLERHHLCVMRAYVAPALRIEPYETNVEWEPLDSPTAKEQAETNLIKAQTAVAYQQTGGFDQYDIREVAIKDKRSDYAGLAPAVPPEDEQPANPVPVGGGVAIPPSDQTTTAGMGAQSPDMGGSAQNAELVKEDS